MSNNGEMHVGVIACRESMPDVDSLVRHFPAELARLKEAVAARDTAAPIRQSRAKAAKKS
jgi:diacylglycerol O-acyltransferase